MKNSETRILVKIAELTYHVALIDCTWQRHKEVKHNTWDSGNTILPGINTQNLKAMLTSSSFTPSNQ